MNLTVILVVAACLQVSAAAYAQERITLTEKNAPLETVFKDIRKQTGYTFFCKYEWLQQAKRVDIDVRNASLEQVLEECFKDQPFSYTIVNKTIMVRPKAEVKKDSTVAPIPLAGRVIDDKGAPLAGASVQIKGTSKGAVTDGNGIFTFKDVRPDARLIISYTGYDQQEIAINDRKFIQVGLKPTINQLDQTVVIAYGTTTRRYLTGDVSTVKSADIAKQPVTDPLLALEGRVPGMFVTQSSGVPGSGVKVRIQGQNSIANGNDPLYVIDGVPYIMQLLPGQGAILGTSGGTNASLYGNPLSYINPADIESIDVLKDADATAIYGSRAANGAVLITTKKGKAGQTRVNVDYQQGAGKVTRTMPLLNTQQYLQMRHQAFLNDGLTPKSTDYDINGTWDTTRNTDWQKALIGGTANYQTADASVSGGTATTQFLVGGTFHRETAIFPGDNADTKGSLHFNINNVSTDTRFHLTLSGSYMVDNNRLPSLDPTSKALTLPPDAPSLYNADGSLNWAQTAAGISTWQNPLAYLTQQYTGKANNLVTNALISYRLLPGLEIKSSLGYTNLQTNETSIIPLSYYAPELRPSTNRRAGYANNTINSWIVEPQITYERDIWKGRLQALAGTTIEQQNNSGVQLVGTGYNSDLVMSDIHSASTVTVNSNLISIYKYNALFGRLNYNLSDKYLIDLTARRDGSSRFGPANEFHNFGAAGIAWIFSKEDFIQQAFPFLSFGKLRASYGTTGNDQVGDYTFLNLYNPTTAQTPYEGAAGLTPAGLYNPYLQWESTRKLQVGLDLGVLKDRILVNTNYFYNRSSNELLNYKLPSLAGFPSILRNLPAIVQNSGWEFSLTSVNIKSRDFDWTTRINGTLPQNKLVSFPGLATSTYAYTLMLGQPIQIARGYHSLGVNPSTGTYWFASGKGGTTSSPTITTDYLGITNIAPRLYGGLENSFRWRGFELDVLFSFARQKSNNYFYGSRPGLFGGSSSGAIGNQPVTVLNPWQKPGDLAAIQRYSTYTGVSSLPLTIGWIDAAASDRAYSDASYIRLKNASLSWTMPGAWMKRMHLQNFRLFAQAQNLVTITGYKGMDPETGPTSLPPLRVLTFGAAIGL